MWFTGINYYKLAVGKDCDSIFTTIHYDPMEIMLLGDLGLAISMAISI
jgi:hypothetical protein